MRYIGRLPENQHDRPQAAPGRYAHLWLKRHHHLSDSWARVIAANAGFPVNDFQLIGPVARRVVERFRP